jgi:hypothetical protein
MTVTRNLLALAAWSVVFFSGLVWSSGTCHIHPPGKESVGEPEPRGLDLYDSLDDCEAANTKYFGGSGRCHCLPDGFMNWQRGDFSPQPKRDFEPPRTERRP